MRLVTFQRDGDPRLGAVRADSAGAWELVDLAAHDARAPRSLKHLLEQGESRLNEVAQVAASAPAVPLAGTRLLPPVPDPQKVICVGLNYADHAAETGATVGDEPVIFCKFPSTLIGHEGTIQLPPESKEVDYEAELVAVIGRRARRIDRAAAWDHIAGYSCGHDVSARDWQ